MAAFECCAHSSDPAPAQASALARINGRCSATEPLRSLSDGGVDDVDVEVARLMALVECNRGAGALVVHQCGQETPQCRLLDRLKRTQLAIGDVVCPLKSGPP